MPQNYKSTWNQLQYLDTKTHAYLITNIFNDKFFLSGIQGVKIELNICMYLGIILYRLFFIYFTFGPLLGDAFYWQGSNRLFQKKMVHRFPLLIFLDALLDRYIQYMFIFGHINCLEYLCGIGCSILGSILFSFQEFSSICCNHGMLKFVDFMIPL